ncbi:MAG: sodium:solute symporter, partial [Planctomycetota bacterium]
MQISGIDLTIIAVYFLFIVGLGCWAGLRRKKTEGANEYFLAGKTLRWPVIGLALFATNISTVHLVSLAEEGYTNGLAYGNFEWMAPFALIMLALFFAPFYIRSQVTTLPDFLEKRYSRASRDWLAVLSIISAIFIHIGFSLYAGAVVLEGMFGIGKMTSIVLIAALTGLYTIVGGLMAVVLTESVQTIILLLGAMVLTGIGYVKVGGWSGIAESV